MKKFVEPELRRIELKLSENIASSGEKEYEGQNFMGSFRTRHMYENCSEVIWRTMVPANYESITANWNSLVRCFAWGTSEVAAARTFGLR